MTFVHSQSQEITVGTTAQKFFPPETPNSADPLALSVREASKARLDNHHASNKLYVARNRTVSSSDFDCVIDGGETDVISLGSATYLSIIADAVNTNGHLLWGNVE